MNLLRNILTAVWCALIIGTNVFALIMMVRVLGLESFLETGMSLVALKMGAMTGFALLSLVSTKFLWAMLAVATFWMLLGTGYELLVQRVWRPSAMLGGLLTIIPTYLLARWNSLVRHTDFNPVKEF